MALSPYFLWTVARNLVGHKLNGELDSIPATLRPLSDHLNSRATPEDCKAAWDGFLASRADRAEIVAELAKLDPDDDPPEVAGAIRRANLGDIRKVMSDAQWIWPGWIPSARLSGIAALEGVGKTRLAMDLARRVWFGLPWPDGQPATLPPGTPTLFLCSDGQQEDLVEIAAEFDMPDESVIVNAPFDSPYEGSTIDGAEALEWLEGSIVLNRPGFTFIDSLTYATSRDLCQANHVKDLMTPIRDIAQRTQSAIVPLLHVSKDGQALGKRIKGLTRTIINLDCPDPDDSARLRLSVGKSFTKKPPALGVTMGDAGNEYDANPPDAPSTGPGPRAAPGRDKVQQFIRENLAGRGWVLGITLRNAFYKAEGKPGDPKSSDAARKAFGRAKEAMIEAGELEEKGGTNAGEQWALCLAEKSNAPIHPDHPF